VRFLRTMLDTCNLIIHLSCLPNQTVDVLPSLSSATSVTPYPSSSQTTSASSSSHKKRISLELVIVIVIVIPLSLVLCFFLLLRHRRHRHSDNQDQEPNTSSVKAVFGLFNGKAKKSLVFPFTVKKTPSPSNIPHLPEKGITGNAASAHRFRESFRSDSRLIPTVTPVEGPNEATMTSETPLQSPYDGDVSYLPEKVVGVAARVAAEANLQQQMNALQDRLGDLHVEQGIASSSTSLNDSHPSAEDSEEILALRQLVEDLRREMHTLRARDRRFSGLTLGTSGTLDEPPPQYQLS